MRTAAPAFSAPLIVALLGTWACAMGPDHIEYAEGRQAEVTVDGLHRIRTRPDSVVFVRPGVDLTRYDEVMLDPVRISYGRASVRHLDADRTRMLEETFRKAFEDELGKSDVYKLVTAPGPKVLRVTPRISGLDITAPQEPGSDTRTDVYVDSAGSMKLILDVADSVTHEALVRAAGEQVVGDPTGTMYETSGTENLSDARIVFRHWALLMRQWLDSVRDIPPLPAEPSS